MTIVIIGGGNLAYHLARVIENNPNLHLVQLCNRSEFTAHFDVINTDKITNIRQVCDADIYILCVKDQVIGEVSAQLPFQGRLVVHTSGNTSMGELAQGNRKGVVYPVQSFSKEKEIDFEQVPICIEAENVTDRELLRKLAEQLSSKVFEMDSEQRKYLHISAVFLNNFTNHLWYLSQQICQKQQIPFEALRPLLAQTLQKAFAEDFYQLQTGPARRADWTTINSHLNLIEEPVVKEIYKQITNSIIKTYGGKEL